MTGGMAGEHDRGMTGHVMTVMMIIIIVDDHSSLPSPPSLSSLPSLSSIPSLL